MKKRIIEIMASPKGAHRNQWGDTDRVPEGWAVIPDEMPIPDAFPFVDIKAEEKTYQRDVKVYNEDTETWETKQEPYTVMTVTSMTAGVKPEPAPTPEPEPGTPTGDGLTADEMASAILEGVNEV